MIVSGCFGFFFLSLSPARTHKNTNTFENTHKYIPRASKRDTPNKNIFTHPSTQSLFFSNFNVRLALSRTRKKVMNIIKKRDKTLHVPSV